MGLLSSEHWDFDYGSAFVANESNTETTNRGLEYGRKLDGVVGA
jgi:hypothetical protein